MSLTRVTQEERSEKLAILSALETRLAEQQLELGQYEDCDPERFKRLSTFLRQGVLYTGVSRQADIA